MRLILTLIMLFAGATSGSASDADFDALLARYVKPAADGVTRVDYTTWKASPRDFAALRNYISELMSRKPGAMPRSEAFAYWVNLYNAVTLQVVLERYPVTSIREIKSDGLLDPKAYLGPWRTKRVTVEGQAYSLDDIEHEVLRPVFKDPRVHYAVNCASYGCPSLRTKAWTTATLNEDLDAAARAYVNHPRGVTVLEGNALRVSSIYKWFGADFGPDEAGVIAHLRRFADPKLAAALARHPRIAVDVYDWSLNDLKTSGNGR